MYTVVVRPRGVNMGSRRLIGAEMEGCQVRDWIVGEKDMSFSREIKETFQWPPMVN